MKKTKEELKKYFEKGDKPTQQQYSDLIDSFIEVNQPVGAPNRRFVIDEEGKVSVVTERNSSDYNLKSYEYNTSEKYKIKLLKEGDVISQVDLTNTFEPILEGIEVLKDIETFDFIKSDKTILSDYSNINEVAGKNGDFTLAVDLLRVIQKKQNIYNLENTLLYLRAQSHNSNPLVDNDFVYTVRLRNRERVGDFYVYTIDQMNLIRDAITSNDVFDIAFRRFDIPKVDIQLPEYTLSEVLGNKLALLKDGEKIKEINLTNYIDDTNLARLVSGTVDVDGLATFKRDDNSTFMVDFSSFLKDEVSKVPYNGAINDVNLGSNDFFVKNIKLNASSSNSIQSQTLENGNQNVLQVFSNNIRVGNQKTNLVLQGADGVSLYVKGDNSVKKIWHSGVSAPVKIIDSSVYQTSITLNTAFSFAQNPIGTLVVNLDETQRYLYARVSQIKWRKFAIGEDI